MTEAAPLNVSDLRGTPTFSCIPRLLGKLASTIRRFNGNSDPVRARLCRIEHITHAVPSHTVMNISYLLAMSYVRTMQLRFTTVVVEVSEPLSSPPLKE